MVRVLALSLLVLSVGFPATAQGKLNFGMNLSSFVDYGSEYPTVDIMKSSRVWFSHNDRWREGLKNAWDTEKADAFALDADGWPTTAIPLVVAGTEAPQVLSTVWANPRALGSGLYTATWTGDADLELDMGAKVESTAAGRITFRVDPNAGVLRLTVLRQSAKNPLRNLAVRAEAETGAVWNPAWVEKLKPFRTLRFMDWGMTNWSPLAKWSDRSQLSWRTWAGPAGAPYEAMIDLANTLGADLWVCVPHQADSDYVRQMARLFRDRVKPGLKVHVEFSNETWNWMFSQTHWLKDNGSQSVDWPERIVPFLQTALDLWTDEWKSRPADLVRVVAVQTGWYDVAQRVARNLRKGSFDVLAGTFYLAFSEKSVPLLAARGASATAADVLRLASQDMLDVEWPRVRALDSLAQELGVRLAFYEGGQHLTPNPFGSEQPYNAALEAAQIDPGMYTLYKDWFAKLKTLEAARRPGGLLAVHFSLASPLDGRYGSWGALTDIGLKPPYLKTAPKYQALLEP